jgi:hypothetical protein
MGRLRKLRNVVLSFGVDCDLFRVWWVDTEVIVDRGALDSYRWLLVTRKMGDGRLVESSAGVDVDCIEYVVLLLR